MRRHSRTLLYCLVILATPAKVHAQTHDLASAVRGRDLAAVQRLVQSGAKVDGFWEDSLGNERTPLMLAAETGQATIAAFLLDAGADPNVHRRGSATALILAANRGSHDIVSALLARGADVNAATEYGATALINAAALDHPEVVRVLLKSDADVDAKMKTPLDANGKTAVVIAAERGNKEVVAILRAHTSAGESTGSTIDKLLAQAADNRTLIAGTLVEQSANELIIEAMGFQYRFSMAPDTRILDGKGDPVHKSRLKTGQAIAVATNRGRLMEVYVEGLALKVEPIGKVRLRSMPKARLLAREVAAMVQRLGFFAAGNNEDSSVWRNSSGEGIGNVFLLDERQGTVVDLATTLMWQRSGAAEPMMYAEAKNYVESLNARRFAGFDDWRLPTLEEGMSLLQPRPRRGGENTLFQRPQPLHLDRVFDSQLSSWTADAAWGDLQWSVGFLSGTCAPRERGSERHRSFVRAVRQQKAPPTKRVKE